MGNIYDEKFTLKEVELGEPPDVEVREKGHHGKVRRAVLFLCFSFLSLWIIARGFYHCRRGNTVGMEPEHDGRRRIIDTGAHSLGGEFDLYDLLSIRSTSGSIAIGVHPQPAKEGNELPAELIVMSHSAQVSVVMLAFNAPERDYRTSIESAHGSIDAHILHGQSTSIASRSGSIAAVLTPYSADDYRSSLGTTTLSGSQEITVTGPAHDRDKIINGMSSVHSTASGSLVLRYPSEWEGTIEGSTGSGGLELHGRDLDIIHRRSVKTAGHYVLAKKGNGNSTLSFHTRSGSVDVYFG